MYSICKSLLALSLTLIIIVSGFAFAERLDPAKGPTFMRADKVEYDSVNDKFKAIGHVYVEFANYILSADKLYYDRKNDILSADGNIRVKDEDGRIVLGESAIFHDQLKQGIIQQFLMKIEDSVLIAESGERINEHESRLYKGVFTPCDISCGREPIWKISSKDTHVDFKENKMTYKHVFFHVYGVPLIYVPYFSHPTPGAPAQSGLLLPSIKQNAYLQPIYIRAKYNLDFTVSPRIAKKYTIFEFEGRHKIRYGQYEINGSYGRVPFVSSVGGKKLKDERIDRYHLFAHGGFTYKGINYGFDIKRTSDKAYLKNYHDIQDNFLTSRLYANSVDRKSYFSLHSYYFQGLKLEDKQKDMPVILPSFSYKKVVPIEDDETSNLTLRNHTITYNESYIRQIGRTSFELDATKNITSSSGQIIEFGVSNRFDLYLLNIDNLDGTEIERSDTRFIPEVKLGWRLPLISNITDRSSLKIEPVASIIVGRPFTKKLGQFDYIDPSKYELDEQSLFDSSKYAGIDFHEFGQRLNYGIHSSLYSDYMLLSGFLGQALFRKNVFRNDSFEFVGNASLELFDQFASHYRFRKDNKLRPIMDEIYASYTYNDFTISGDYTKLNDISRYFAEDRFNTKNNQVKQFGIGSTVRLFDSFLVSGATKYNISDTDKPRKLSRSIKVTYEKDCVSISGTIADDFTRDSARGIDRIPSKSFSVGLKVLNM